MHALTIDLCFNAVKGEVHTRATQLPLLLLSSELISHVLGTRSQWSSSLMSPKSVCRVTDWKGKGRRQSVHCT